MGRGGPDRGKRPDKIARENATAPTEPIGTTSTARGIVKWWERLKGYGAIATDKTAPWDIWCHFASIEGTGFRELVPGEAVEVEYVRAPRESFQYVASAVRRLAPPTNAADADDTPLNRITDPRQDPS